MPNLLLKSLKILSRRESRARMINFHPNKTIIFGGNSSGKSSVVKSLLYAFGTSPKSFEKEMGLVITDTVVEFSVGKDEYILLRQGDTFYLSENSSPPQKYTSVGKGIGPKLSDILNFRVRLLANGSGDASIPPPAYYFLPFYLDQDGGWKAEWESFERLGQYQAWHQTLREYFSGIKNNKYFEIEQQVKTISKAIETSEDEFKAVVFTKRRLIAKLPLDSAILSKEDFAAQISELEVALNSASSEVSKKRSAMMKLINELKQINDHISVAEGALKELKMDHHFLLSNSDGIIHCPTCGSLYDRINEANFDLANDKGNIEQFLIELNHDKALLINEINNEQGDLFKLEENFARIRSILEYKVEQYSLEDVIRNRSRSAIADSIAEEEKTISHQIQTNREILKDLKSNQRQMQKDTREKIDIINNEYTIAASTFFSKLNIDESDIKQNINLTTKLQSSGSRLPRIIIGRHYALRTLIAKHSDVVLGPLIIDTPFQQGQDQENKDAILNFIMGDASSNNQVILAIEEFNYSLSEGEGEVLHLLGKRELLTQSSYQEIDEYINQFILRAGTEQALGE